MRGAILVLMGALLLYGCAQQGTCGSEVNYVCGDDGVTYQNPCLAEAAGANISSKGQCQSNATNPDILCSDSDNGKNLLIRGTSHAKGQPSVEDYCAGFASVQENFCEGGELKVETIPCPAGTACGGGRCSEICNDSDGGQKAGTKGTLSKGNISLSDKCSDSKHVIEYYCDSENEARNTTLECASGEACSGGACVTESMCTDSDGGDEADTKGTVVTESASYTDYCKDNFTVNEYGCSGKRMEETALPCPEEHWCSGGECRYMNCLDNDAGKDKRISSYVAKGPVRMDDTCDDSNTVTEYYCEANDIASVDLDCASDEICSGGRCVEASCIDSDGGNVPLSAGTVAIGSIEKSDICTNLTLLKEYRCNADDYTYSTIDCYDYLPGGIKGICWMGVCAQTYCTDSDGGNDENVSGTATMTTSNGYSSYQSDDCLNSRQVAEWFCDGNWLKVEKISCIPEMYCSVNRCVDSPCIDSDGGSSYIVAGTLTKGLRSEQDVCLDSDTLREWTCSGNTVVSEDYTCPIGCNAAERRCVPL